MEVPSRSLSFSKSNLFNHNEFFTRNTKKLVYVILSAKHYSGGQKRKQNDPEMSLSKKMKTEEGFCKATEREYDSAF